MEEREMEKDDNNKNKRKMKRVERNEEIKKTIICKITITKKTVKDGQEKMGMVKEKQIRFYKIIITSKQ